MLASLWPYGTAADVRILDDAKVSATFLAQRFAKLRVFPLVRYLSFGRVDDQLMISFCRGTRWDVSVPRHHWNDEFACQRKYITIVTSAEVFSFFLLLLLARTNDKTLMLLIKCISQDASQGEG